jgi:DNA-binding XRE family transcriptional regulator
MNSVDKPLGTKVLTNPKTIGEKLKNRRLRLGLLQKDVAQIIGVCEDSITLWENNRNEPQVNCYPKIIEFLGYEPFEVDTSTLGGQIKLYRYQNGLSQAEFAKILGVNESTVFHYENNRHQPNFKTIREIELLLKAFLENKSSK